MTLGLGTGSTMSHFLDLLGDALASGRLTGIVGVATSERTAEHATRLDIPVAELSDVGELDLAIDGADEVDPALDLIKGLGGALLREKMIAQAAARFVVIVDDRKEVPRLGTRSPLPVEVVPFAWASHLQFLRTLGGRPVRREQEGRPYTTDNGNFIVDVHFDAGIELAAEIDAALHARAGIVDTGFFLDLADEVLVAEPRGTTVRRRGAW